MLTLWLQGNSSPELKSVTPPPPQSHQTPSIKAPNKLPSPKATVINMKPSCEGHLKVLLGFDKCNEECFAKKLLTHHKDLSDFVLEKWTYFNRKGEAKSRLGRLYIAVSSAEINFTPNLIPKKDLAKAEKMLAEIMREDPKNLYPALFYAYVLKRRGKIAEAQKVLRDAVQSGSYESYIPRYRLEIMKAAGTDILSAMVAIMTTATYFIPEPRLYEIEELQEISKVDFIKAMIIIANKRKNAENKGQDLLWDLSDDKYSREYLEQELPDVYQRLPKFEDRDDNKTHDLIFFTPRPDDGNCNVEDVKENLAKRLEYLKSL